jgi:DNA-binding transcriptional LysR family regulator
MTTNQLKYFITAAECLNFTEAGKRHFISQTAITQHIQSLEEQLEVKLFIRDKRHVELTPAGKVFLIEARAILERSRTAVEKTQKAATGFSGSLNIGYVKGQENTRFGSLVMEFYQHYPNIDFQLFREAHLDLFYDLDRKKLDIAFNICYSNTDLTGFEYRKVGSQQLYAVLYPSHPYAQLSSIRRYDLRNDSFFLTKFYDNNHAKDYGHIIPEKFADSGFIPKIAGKSSDTETLLLLVASGIGITILPESAIRYVRQSDGLVFIPLEGEHEQIDVLAIWKADNQNPALKAFLGLLN